MHDAPAHSGDGAPEVTLLVCTYNRSADLREMLGTAVRQETDGGFGYEIVVVDNNSTDDTAAVVQRFRDAGHRHVRYLFESRQGKSHALNTGLAAARGVIYTIVDDDFVLPPDWVKRIVRTFRARPDISFVSGKVLPLWLAAPPAWMSPDHYSALALADYGDEPFESDAQRQVCLLACSFRRADVLAVGGYAAALGVTAGEIGGVEDLEILQRLWAAGRKGLYVPDITFQHKVQAGRLTKRYHRRWHTGHGRYYARLRDADFERSSGRVMDIPLHVFRQLLAAAWRWLRHTLHRNSEAAFLEETRLRFLIGFIAERIRQVLTPGAARVSPRNWFRWRPAAAQSRRASA